MLGIESGGQMNIMGMKKMIISNQDDFINLFIFCEFSIPENKEIFFENINLEDFLSSFSYIPTENRLGHMIGSKLYLKTVNLDLEDKVWALEIFKENVLDIFCKLFIEFTDNLIAEDIDKYRMIFQLCLNGDLEDRDTLDKIGKITQTSVWRCSYCGGIFGLTYLDCLEHEGVCPRNPINFKKVGNIEDEQSKSDL